MQVDCRKRIATRRGYVLMVVIAVSVLVITVLGSLATQSLRRGLAAADAERSLQQRWGALTLETELLYAAPKVFELQHELAKQQSPPVRPPSTIRAALTLNGITFDLLLGDEDAKLSLNAMYHHVGQQKTEAAILEMVGPVGRSAVRMLPASKPQQIARENTRLNRQPEDADDESVIPDAFRSWGEVFDLANLEHGVGSDAGLPNLTTSMTCWGNGQLNFQRASDNAILAVIGSIIQDGGAQRILSRYQKNPLVDLEILLQSEVSNRKHRDELKQLLSQASTNFSIWIDASSRASGSVRTFTVTRRDSEGVTRQSKFMH
ncbi:MAG: hypothetical protein AB8B91_22875 [Rubripirellula sp.]